MQCAIAVPCREMAVIQDPQFHVQLSGFINDDIQIMPPPGSAEVRVRTAFQTDSMTACIMNDIHILPECLFILTTQPEKREHIPCCLSAEQFCNLLVHDGFPAPFLRCLR